MAYNQHMRVLREYKSDMHKKLREGLAWMFENNLQPKLEGRYRMYTDQFVCAKDNMYKNYHNIIIGLANSTFIVYWETYVILKVLM